MMIMLCKVTIKKRQGVISGTGASYYRFTVGSQHAKKIINLIIGLCDFNQWKPFVARKSDKVNP
jgi:hypothetical protein